MHETIQMMWTGPHLPKMQRYCLDSFIRNGHPIELYTYHGCDYVRDGITILDAHDILPREKVFTPVIGDKIGNLSTFSDLFRYTLLAQKGGWWVDTDTYCLRPFNYTRKHLMTFDAQTYHWLVTTPFKTIAGHKTIRHILELADAIPRDSIKFNEMGSKLLNANILQHRDMLKYAEPFEAFQPWDYNSTEKWITDPAFPAVSIATRSIHLFNEIWRSRKWDTDGNYPIFDALDELTSNVEGQDRTWDQIYPIEPIKAIRGNLEDDVTMVVKAFNRPEALLKMLKSIRQYYPRVQILIADDGKARLTPADWDDPRTKTFYLPFNSGLSAGRNFLVDRVHTPFTLLLDDDYVFTKTTDIKRLYDVLRNNKDIALAGGLAQCRWTPGLVYVGTLALKNDELHMATGVRERRKDCVLVDFVPNFFLGRTAALQDVHWDSHIKIGYEHPDFFLRLLGRYKAAFCEDVRIDHEPMAANPAYDDYRSPKCQRDYLRYLFDKWRVKRFYNKGLIIHYPEVIPVKPDPVPIAVPVAVPIAAPAPIPTAAKQPSPVIPRGSQHVPIIPQQRKPTTYIRVQDRLCALARALKPATTLERVTK